MRKQMPGKPEHARKAQGVWQSRYNKRYRGQASPEVKTGGGLLTQPAPRDGACWNCRKEVKEGDAIWRYLPVKHAWVCTHCISLVIMGHLQELSEKRTPAPRPADDRGSLWPICEHGAYRVSCRVCSETEGDTGAA